MKPSQTIWLRLVLLLLFWQYEVDASALPKSLDTNFTVSLRKTPDIRSIQQEAGGSYLVSGSFRFVNNAPVFDLTRLTPDWEFDPSFDTSSLKLSDLRAISPQANGKVVIGDSQRLIRLERNGRIDPTFNEGHIAGGTFSSIYTHSDGSLWVFGAFTSYNGHSSTGMVQLNATGAVRHFGHHSLRAAVLESCPGQTTIFLFLVSSIYFRLAKEITLPVFLGPERLILILRPKYLPS